MSHFAWPEARKVIISVGDDEAGQDADHANPVLVPGTSARSRRAALAAPALFTSTSTPPTCSTTRWAVVKPARSSANGRAANAFFS
ncbi:hypothetical protein ACH4D3_13160 [Streptomyces sp. NPDC018026]|uniref:hypothetical protein n=1 Tax=Streptomyces sp. NPDC018026 TaxID=3365031 RepID=UPI0037B32879